MMFSGVPAEGGAALAPSGIAAQCRAAEFISAGGNEIRGPHGQVHGENIICTSQDSVTKFIFTLTRA